jgi:fibronectin type 3 domain-containing protein
MRLFFHESLKEHRHTKPEPIMSCFSFPVRYAVRLLTLLVICTWFGTPSLAPATEEPPLLCPEVTLTVDPLLRTTIYNRVAVAPVQADDPQLAAELTEILYKSLKQAKKYTLVAPKTVAEQLAREKNAAKNPPTPAEIGQRLKTGAVIELILEEKITDTAPAGDDAPYLFFVIHMIDSRTGKVRWQVSSRCPERRNIHSINADLLGQTVSRGIEELIRTLVAKGDIFSTVLPQPTIIASRGELRAARIVLQPDPTYVYRSYRLLGADREDGVFSPRTPPVANDHAPIILEDKGLRDATTYYYTVTGIAENGLANVPAQPLAITTSGAPRPLAGLQASGNSLRHIRLFWEPSQDPNVTGYSIYRAADADGPFEKIAELDDRSRQSYIDYGSSRNSSYGSLADDREYFYTIRTRNKVGVESEPTQVVSARTKGAPPPPAEIRAIANQPGRIPLFWAPADDPDIRGYSIHRSMNQNGPFDRIDFVRGRESQEYTDSGSWTTPLKNNTTYFYKIQSVNVLDIASPFSSTVSATTKPAPSTVRGIRVTDNLFRAIELTWQPNPEADITGYEIYRGRTGDELQKIALIQKTRTEYTDSGLRDGTTYWYQVRAIDRDNLKGDFFSPVSGTTKPRPEPPSGLKATLTDRGIELHWQQSSATDAACYEIFTVGFLNTAIGTTKDTFFLYRENIEAGDAITFQVRTVDRDGLESVYSQPVTIHIPSPGQPEITR